MAEQEQTSKRQREEDSSHQVELELQNHSKRQKSFTQILSILDDEEDESNQEDLSDIFTTLQRELSSCDDPTTKTTTASDCPGNKTVKVDVDEEEEEGEERHGVMRHLLQASDDELGIPNNNSADAGSDEIVNVGDNFFSLGDNLFSLGDGFWEFEDEAANYYTLLQSQLFM